MDVSLHDKLVFARKLEISKNSPKNMDTMTTNKTQASVLSVNTIVPR